MTETLAGNAARCQLLAAEVVNAPRIEITSPFHPTFSGSHNAVSSAELDQLRLDGKLHNPAGFAVAADIIDAGDEFTKGPGSFRGITFHNLKLHEKTGSMSWGVHPIGV